MIIIKPLAIIKNKENLQNALQQIEYAARISHRSEEDMNVNKTKDFIQRVIIDRGDWSVTEHVSAQVEFIMERAISLETVRHRLFSYTQESQRFVNYKNKMRLSFIYPKPDIQCKHCLDGDEPTRINDFEYKHTLGGQLAHFNSIPCSYDPHWLYSIEKAEKSYISLLERGWRPQEARSVLPNAASTKILMTGNLRSWRHFFLMRTTKQAHPQMREITIPLLEEFKQLIPVLYDDILPNSIQIENVRKGS